MNEPKKVKVKISRWVTEIALCTLDRDGHVEEIEEILEELEDDELEVKSIIEVYTVH